MYVCSYVRIKHLVSFEKISVLDSYFIHRYMYIIIKYNIGQVQFRVKSVNYYLSYGPFATSFFTKCLQNC